MTAPSTPSRPGGIAGYVRTVLALDGALATTALTVFQYFVVSVSFFGCLVPVVAFNMLVGWQPTHLALWLGAVSLLPLAPAVFALLRSTRALLERRAGARAGRRFWAAFGAGWRSLWWAAAGTSLMTLLLSYDLALFGAADAMLLFVAAAGAVLAVLLIAVCAAAAANPGLRPVPALGVAAAALARRPHVGLSWPLLIGLGIAAASLPLIGSALALFLPALLGVGIHICNDALRMPLTDETRRAS